jgi:hypothetical protein
MQGSRDAIRTRKTFGHTLIESLGSKIINGKFPLIGRSQIGNSFKTLVDRNIRERRRDERQLAEQRTTKHQFQARKSCVADARGYRVARRLPVPTTRFDWKTLIPADRLNKFRSACFKKFRDYQFERWLTSKIGA